MTTSTRTPKLDPKPDSRVRRPPSEFTAEWREPERTLVDYLAAIWSRKMWIVVAMAVSTAAATAYALTQPNVYASQASLFVIGNRSGANAAEVAANMLRMGNIGPSQVLSALEVVNSTVVAQRVVDSVGPEEITRPYQPERASEEERAKMGIVDVATDWMHGLQAKLFQASASPLAAQPEFALEQFRRNFAAWADERAMLVKLTYRAGSRTQAQRILEEVVHVAVDRYREVCAPPESRQFVLQKLESAEKEYTEAKVAYDQFLATHGRMKFTEEIAAAERARASVESLLDTQKRARDNARENLQKYVERLGETEELRKRTREITEPAAGARVELLKERVRVEGLRIDNERRGGSDSDRKSFVAQLENIDRRLEELDQPRKVTVVDDNPDYLLLDAKIRELSFKRTELDHEIPSLEGELTQQTEHLRELYTWQHEGDRIAEAMARSKTDFERLRDMRDAYEISAQLETLGLTSLQPVDDPTLPLQKEGPRRGRIIVAGMAAGLLASITLIMLLVRMSRTFLRTSEVAVCLGRGDVVGMPWLDRGNVRRFRLARKRGWD
ncbi:MAG: Wzz/FepE/Etk N-terminal domain-containing protein [Planctomycetota bacterium]